MTYLFTNQKRNQRGFSLIELMVVVAIIGLLAAVAIPNYQRFQRRAVQTEAKTSISALYTAEIAFINEWGYGTTNLDLLGFDREGGLPYYVIGWHLNDQEEEHNPINVTSNHAARYRGPKLTTANEVRRVNSYELNTTGNMAYDVPQANLVADEMEQLSTCVCASASTTSATAVTETACNIAANSGCNDGASTPQPAQGNWENGGVINTSIKNVDFTIGATGVINGHSTNANVDDNVDQWTINRAKVIENTKSGL